MGSVNNIESIFNFLKEARKLQHTYRFTPRPGGGYENDAEHSWAVAFTCMLLVTHLEKEFNRKLDHEKALKMALIHDMAEIYTGDTKTWDKKSREGKEDRERAAIQRITKELPDDIRTELLELWEECEAKETLEAKIVKSVDRLDPVLHRTTFDDVGWKNVEGIKGVGTVESLDETQYVRHNFSKTLSCLYETIRDQAVAKGMLKKEE